jgi:methionyl-tRNA formyltransferase
MSSAASSVKKLALSRHLDIYQPHTLRDDAVRARVEAARPELLVVAAYGLILPAALLGVAKGGALNIHASLLPRWRGAAPIQRALLAGDEETGVTLMYMDAGLDTGPMLSQQRISIAPDDDAKTLHDRLAALGAQMLVGALSAGVPARQRATAQPDTGVTYATKIDKGEATIDWRLPARRIERHIRAFRPAPGATTRLQEETLKFWRAELRDAHGAPGTILSADDAGIMVACGEGALLVAELQRAGGRRLCAAEFLRGHSLPIGARLQ